MLKTAAKPAHGLADAANVAEVGADRKTKADAGRIARAAMVGIEAHRLATGGWLVHRWNLHRELASDAEFDAWLARVGSRA